MEGTPTDFGDSLMAAGAKGQLTIARRLIAAGASKDSIDANGMTACDYATRNGRQEQMRLLK